MSFKRIDNKNLLGNWHLPFEMKSNLPSLSECQSYCFFYKNEIFIMKFISPIFQNFLQIRLDYWEILWKVFHHKLHKAWLNLLRPIASKLIKTSQI